MKKEYRNTIYIDDQPWVSSESDTKILEQFIPNHLEVTADYKIENNLHHRYPTDVAGIILWIQHLTTMTLPPIIYNGHYWERQWAANEDAQRIWQNIISWNKDLEYLYRDLENNFSNRFRASTIEINKTDVDVEQWKSDKLKEKKLALVKKLRDLKKLDNSAQMEALKAIYSLLGKEGRIAELNILINQPMQVQESLFSHKTFKEYYTKVKNEKWIFYSLVH